MQKISTWLRLGVDTNKDAGMVVNECTGHMETKITSFMASEKQGYTPSGHK